MLTKIIIEKLFNTFDYTIELKPEGITILTGPNGYGKTTVLKILDSLAKRDIQSFIQLPFKKISLQFSDAPLIVFTRDNTGTFIETNGNKQKLMSEFARIAQLVAKQKPILHLRSDEVVDDDQRWVDRNSGQRFTEDTFEVNDKFQSFLDENALNVPEVYFIREQRLLGSSSNLDSNLNTVEEYSIDLNHEIKDSLATFSKITQELDSSFPHRLFAQQEKISEAEFKQRFQRINAIQRILNNYDIADFKEDNHPAYREEDARALAVYIEDTEKKLAVFAELLEKLNLFTEILNKRRFTFKQIHISRDDGFTLLTEDGKPLKLRDLSSGEQQEVVMLYELLFLVQPNTLVLIDEPELSLHVVWQQEFLKDLEKIVAWQKIQVIIATHSPQIINDRWDLVVDLWDLHHAKPTE